MGGCEFRDWLAGARGGGGFEAYNINVYTYARDAITPLIGVLSKVRKQTSETSCYRRQGLDEKRVGGGSHVSLQHPAEYSCTSI